MFSEKFRQVIEAARYANLKNALEMGLPIDELNPDLVQYTRQAQGLIEEGVPIDEVMRIVLSPENVAQVERMGR